MKLLLPVGLKEKIIAGIATFNLTGAGSAEVFTGCGDRFGRDGTSQKWAGRATAAKDRDNKWFFGWGMPVGGEDTEESLFGGVTAPDPFDLEGYFKRDGRTEHIVEINVLANFSNLIGLNNTFRDLDAFLGF